MTLTDVLLILLLGVVVATAGIGLHRIGRGADVAAPRGQRIVVTDVDDDSYEGFLVHEDRHRLVLEGASLLQAENRKIGMAGRQHFRTARVKRVQELSD